jgi:hypothetical protein
MIGRVQSRMPEPVADHGYVDAGGDELNADAVAPRVRCNTLCRERRYVAGSGLNLVLELEAHPCRTERLTVAIDEYGFVIGTRISSQQCLEQVHRFRP